MHTTASAAAAAIATGAGATGTATRTGDAGTIANAGTTARAASPGALPSPALAQRLAELCGDERNVQVDFLLHLAEFDARRAWAEAGYGSLWTYCLEVLHLREGAAWRRIGAMKLLRRFPSLEAPLRDGRLCLTTVNLLAPLLTDQTLADLVARAAFLSKADTERLVVSIRPRVAPRDGIRKLAEPAPRSELRAISEDAYSLRVTLDAATAADLRRLVALRSHAAGGDLAAVVGEAIRDALARHGKRKGAVAPERTRAAPASKPGAADPRAVPMEVRREVWKRDGGACAWTSAEGKRCGSTWRLELGHLLPVALGGLATVENLRVECGVHNQHEALRVFGVEHMARWLGAGTSSGASRVP